ncbi:cell wall-binding repeat-containing protein [Herbiconiux ginsengi]|nr:cell wall-binding repeat-containing protein [Herbiconiux ginsengi]
MVLVGGTAAAASAVGIATMAASNENADSAATASDSLALNSELQPLVSSAGLPTPERVSGADRFDGAVKISQRAFPGQAPVVYVASGENFPDALGAGPAASHEGGPLLLTTSASLPTVVQTEITRLAPSKIVAVGGVNTISPAVFTVLQSLAPTVVRIDGADRFEVSRRIAAYAFASSSKAYVVTGVDFPDALGTGSAAASKDAPVILVNGTAAAVDAPTLTLLQNLGVTQVWIGGGPNSVSTGIESSLDASRPTYRLAGNDRFLGSEVINREAFTENSNYVVLASGAVYPDALSGSALAGALNAPLYLVPSDCVPDGVLSDIRSRSATNVLILGGVNTLGAPVQSLTSCGW